MSDLQIPKNEWADVKRMVREASRPEMISEKEAADLLGIMQKSLKNYVYSGRIKPNMYTTAPNGRRFYNKEKLMGK